MSKVNYSYAFASNHDDCDFTSDKYLQINNCGALRVNNIKGGHSNRPPRNDFMLIYLYEGNGWAEPRGYCEEMHEGDILVLKPGTALNFGFNYNSLHFWIHFAGSAVDEILKECDIFESNIFKIGVTKEYWDVLTDIYLQHSFGSNSSLLKANGLFLTFLGEITSILNPSLVNKEIGREKKIYPAIKDMRINFNKNYNLNYYAELCGISLSSFQHTFTKITGVTPQRYLITIRIENAKKMLTNSELSIKEVAQAVGYEDQLYFSRLFKKYEGISPRKFSKL